MFRNIPLIDIDPNPDQPRTHFAGIEELAQSIRDEGLLEPVMVRPLDSRYQLVHGERRYRAARLAGLETIPAMVREMDDDTTFKLSLLENMQRAALTPMEEATSFARLQEQGHTQAEIGRIVGKGQSYVAHKLRLLKAPPPLTYYLEVGAITENHFRQAMRLKSIIGASIPDNLTYPDNVDWFSDKEGSFILARMRTLGKVQMLPPSEVLNEGVRRWLEYISKHADAEANGGMRPLWERHAFWALSAMVATNTTVAEATGLVDRLEGFYLSAIANYVIEGMDKSDQEDWCPIKWAVYHDLKHSGLLGIHHRKSCDDEATLVLRALGYAGQQNPYWPSEAHAPGAQDRLVAAIKERCEGEIT